MEELYAPLATQVSDSLLLILAEVVLVVVIFLGALLLFLYNRRANAFLRTPQVRRLTSIGLALLFFLLGLTQLFLDRNTINSIFFLLVSLLLLALALGQKGEP